MSVDEGKLFAELRLRAGPLGGSNGSFLIKAGPPNEWISENDVASNLAANSAFLNAFSDVPLGWSAVSFSGTWGNYGSGFQVCQHRKWEDWVQLRGMASGGASATTMFGLPSGSRPPAPIIFPAAMSGLFGWIQVNTDGTVVCNGTTTWVSLDGIAFCINA